MKVKINPLFKNNYETYIWTLFWQIEGHLEKMKSHNYDTSLWNVQNGMNFLENFFWKKPKSGWRQLYWIASYAAIDFYLYPLKDIFDLSIEEGKKLSYYKGETIIRENNINKQKYKEKEIQMCEALQKVKSDYHMTIKELMNHPLYTK